MNCDQYRDLIQEFHDGELPRQKEAFLFTHMSSCEECREFLHMLNLSSVTIKEEILSFPHSLDERILRRAASVQNTSMLSGRIPVYVTYALALLFLAISIFTINSSRQYKSEIGQVIHALDQQNAVVREQSRQIEILLNGLPETQISSELQNKIIINAKM